VFHSLVWRRSSPSQQYCLRSSVCRTGWCFAVLSFDISLNVKKRGAGIFTKQTFDVGFELFWELLLWGGEVLGLDGAIMERSPLRNSRRQPATGGIERKRHQHLHGLCRREDLRHDTISGNTSEALLFQL
jgi:hypothetical protein